MAEISITVTGLDKLYKALGIDPLVAMQPEIDASGHRVEGKFRVYPPPIAPGVWAANTSPKQKAAFFAKLKRGEGGGRTGQYGGAWMTTVSRTATTVTAETKNPTNYAGWVGSEDRQARFHRGRWPTDVKILEAEAPRLLAGVQQRVISAYARA